MAMNKRFFIYSIIFTVIHFTLTMISIYNGLIIFRTASTPVEIFWDRVMNAMLFPVSIVFQGSTSELVQTLSIILNSIFWGILFAVALLSLQKRLKP